MTRYNHLFTTLFLHDCKISYRQGSEYILALSFWLLIVCFFPLAGSASPNLLQSFAPGIIWLGLLLTQLLNLPKFFRDDYQEGILAELMRSPNGFFVVVIFKLFNFWLIHFLPVLLLAPLLGIMLHLSAAAMLSLEITILLGSPTLTLLSGFVASLTIAIKNNTLLVNLLFLPLTVPILIFATGAVTDQTLGIPAQAPLAWLGVILLMSLTIFPMAICSVLKANFD